MPDGYDGSGSVALFVTLPGYQGLYFQGVGANVRTEDFGFEAQAYDTQMIVLAPQLSDWGETSARQTIALVEWMLRAYAIDRQRVYLEGYSGGGETLSLVMGMRPQLFCRALFCASRWDGELNVLADARVPVYLVVGESDEYYGSEPATSAAHELEEIYRSKGLDEAEVANLVALDVKPASYFEAGGVSNQHGHGGALFCRDPQIMGWLFED
ncbi:prolyl oligopeptidase family serine peptidase [Paratractidigestivibacter sp.]|uniref:prolyl oligopeptidase family serine peptidase n=1 Tax=Paratractidigestivibacter sp. TaxID=2847316 RepID=UPI002ABD4A18|nr:prolyl oligopeptidase family serine peptidase [Paratractidigestivibacter sp.]